MRLVPVVALVPEEAARRIDEITRAREQHVDDSEALASLKALAAQNGWTMQMLALASIRSRLAFECVTPTVNRSVSPYHASGASEVGEPSSASCKFTSRTSCASS